MNKFNITYDDNNLSIKIIDKDSNATYNDLILELQELAKNTDNINIKNYLM